MRSGCVAETAEQTHQTAHHSRGKKTLFIFVLLNVVRSREKERERDTLVAGETRRVVDHKEIVRTNYSSFGPCNPPLCSLVGFSSFIKSWNRRFCLLYLVRTG